MTTHLKTPHGSTTTCSPVLPRPTSSFLSVYSHQCLFLSPHFFCLFIRPRLVGHETPPLLRLEPDGRNPSRHDVAELFIVGRLLVACLQSTNDRCRHITSSSPHTHHTKYKPQPVFIHSPDHPRSCLSVPCCPDAAASSQPRSCAPPAPPSK